MNWVDVLVIGIAVLAAISGARQGVVTAVASFAGVLAGAVVGVRLAPLLVSHVDNPTTRMAIGVGVVVLLVALGETAGVWLGRMVRDRIRVQSLRHVDNALGAVVQGLAVLVVAWLVALPLVSASFPQLAGAVRRSAVLGEVDDVMPGGLRDLPAGLRRLLDSSGFPDVLAPFASTPVTDVGPPDPALQSSAIVKQLQASVVKIRGNAPSCAKTLEGSGFVIAPGRVATNAHVVAGTNSNSVEVPGGGTLRARVVSYDPETDIAVLAVPGLNAPVLHFAPAVAISGAGAIVLGYPLDGPYTASAARIRQRIQLRGPDIYEANTITRDVYTVRAQVRSGNSGGPLVDPSGAVLGVVFGAAVDDPETGFVLTAEQVAKDLANPTALTTSVATGRCAA